MPKRPRQTALGFSQNKKARFRICLSDGITEEAIENFTRNKELLSSLLEQLQSNQLSVFKTSGVGDQVLLEISSLLKGASKLSRLVLVQGSLSSKSLRSLMIALQQRQNITYLDIRENALSENSIRTLVSNLSSTYITTLNLGNNSTNLQEFIALKAPCLLNSLALDGNFFLDTVPVIVNILNVCSSLSYLSLVDCNISGEQLFSLVPVICRHPSLSVLHLSCNPLHTQGIHAVCELIRSSIGLDEIHIIGVEYSESDGQMIVDSLAARKGTPLKVFPTSLTRRANYLKRMYPGKNQMLDFLQKHNLDSHKELFFRFEITVESLADNEYLLSCLEKYQLDHRETSIICRAIDLSTRSFGRARSNTNRQYDQKILQQHLVITDIRMIDDEMDIIDTLGVVINNPYTKGMWNDYTNIRVKKFDCDSADLFYQLQAAGNRLFRLRHPFVLDFLGMFLFGEYNEKLAMVFENFQYVSVKEWIYSTPGREVLKSKKFTYSLLQIALKVAQALDYISRQQKLLYCELNIDKVALRVTGKNEFIPKILDFGIDCLKKGEQQNLSRWLPPEGKSPFADSWMFGIFLWELFMHAERSVGQSVIGNHETIPFHQIDEENLLSYQISGVKLNQPDRCPSDVYRVICSATNLTPSKRPSLGELYKQILNITKLHSTVLKQWTNHLPVVVVTSDSDGSENYTINEDFVL